MPPGYQWAQLDIETNDEHVAQLYEMLKDHYVEDLMSTIRFNYSPELLKWALCPPGYVKEWHVALRGPDGMLMASIMGIPATMVINGNAMPTVIINFLCIHKKLRSKRLAPVMIKEVTRRVRLTGIHMAVYTSGTYLPRPMSKCQYYHRTINVKKLVETSFSYIKKNMTMARTIKLFKMPAAYQV